MTDYAREQARAILAGNPPDDLDLDQCGAQKPTLQALAAAHEAAGTKGARDVWVALTLQTHSLIAWYAGDDPEPLRTWTADDILTATFPEPVWAIPDLLPVGLAILAGNPKVGKSWLALQIAQAVATGGRALGIEVERGPVLYMALEDPPRRLQERMRAQGWPMGSGARFLALDTYLEQIGGLLDGGGERLGAEITREGYRLVVLDTLSRAIIGDQMDVAAMTAALTPLQAQAQEQNAAVVMVDHHRKGRGENADAIGDILGSTAKGAMVDTAWGLYRERGKAGAKLQITGREIVEQTLALQFDPLTMCWQNEGDEGAIEITPQRQRIVDAVVELGVCGVMDIANATGLPKGNAHNQLQDLVAAGKLIRYTEGRNVFYALPTT
jgi:hypothetical protein